MFVAGFAAGIRDGALHVDHLAAEITFCSVSHLSRLDVEVLHFDVELVERTRRQPDKYLLSVLFVSLLRRVRQNPILAFLAVASWTQRDRPGELVGNVVPFVVPEPG